MRITQKYLHASPDAGGGSVPSGNGQPQGQPSAQASAPVTVVHEQSRTFPAPQPPAPPAQTPVGAQAPVTSAGQAVLTPQTVLQGDFLPEELRGATLEQAMRWWNVMAQEFMKQQREKTAGGQQPPAQQPPAQPVGAPDPNAARNSFLADPEAAIRRIVGEMVAPVAATASATAVERNIANLRARFPDFAQHEQEIFRSLQGATREQLADPSVLENAYYWQIGRNLRTAKPATPSAPPANTRPAVPFFSEPPAGAPPTGTAPSQIDEVMARKFGISLEDYRANSGRR